VTQVTEVELTTVQARAIQGYQRTIMTPKKSQISDYNAKKDSENARKKKRRKKARGEVVLPSNWVLINSHEETRQYLGEFIRTDDMFCGRHERLSREMLGDRDLREKGRKLSEERVTG